MEADHRQPAAGRQRPLGRLQPRRPVRRIRRSPRCGSPESCGSPDGSGPASAAAGSPRRSAPAARVVAIGALAALGDDGAGDPARRRAPRHRDRGCRPVRPRRRRLTSRRRFRPRRRHPHVQRAVLLEREPALGPVELHRRDPQIHHHAVDRRRHGGPCWRTCRATSSIRSPQSPAQPAASSKRQRIAVDGDDRGGAGVQQAAGIAAGAEGGVDPDAGDRRDGGQQAAPAAPEHAVRRPRSSRLPLLALSSSAPAPPAGRPPCRMPPAVARSRMSCASCTSLRQIWKVWPKPIT